MHASSSTTMSEIVELECTEVKHLYQASTADRSWDARWSEYRDASEENRSLQPYRSSFPIIHKWEQVINKVDDWDESTTSTWVTHSIEVNDIDLRSKLYEVLQDVPGLNFDSDVLAFKPPFAPFLHKWTTFKSVVEEETDNVKLKDLLKHLYEIVAPTIDPTLEKINNARECQTIDWDLLISTCVPGELVYGTRLSKPQAYKILKAEVYRNSAGYKMLDLSVEHYDWDGQRSGYRQFEYRTQKFYDEKPLADLEYIPFKFLKKPEQISEELVARGQRFENMIGYHFKHYSGTKLAKTSGGPLQRSQFNGRIIVDAYAYHKYCDEQWIEAKNTTTEHGSASDIEALLSEEVVHDGDRNEHITPFSNEQLLLSVATVKAFDIVNKEWCQVYIDGLSDIVFNDNAYDKLVLEEDEKKMILAFSQQVRGSATDFDDIIKNKGRGVIMLLCGPPGVGKTLTAESVAERAHHPLYAVHAGDIGHDANSADQALQTVLECCRLWNAILLLDEADVFLEARSADNLVRNELVSVFLRRLEYFGGLSFLTTNRPRSIDPAFESRLDLIIPYPDLDDAARRTVWTTFISQLEKSNGHNITGADYDKLAEHKCNGREIKNIVKIALMLAVQEKSKLSMSHITTVLKLRIKAAKTVGIGQLD